MPTTTNAGERQRCRSPRAFLAWRHAELHQPERHQRQLRRVAPACSPSPAAASVANYQAALQSITFSSTSDNPTSFGTDTSRTITWQVNDGTLDSNADTSDRDRHGGQRRPRRDGSRHTVELHRAAARRSCARCEPDGERRRQRRTWPSASVSISARLLRRRHAELHRPERHHRQLQQRRPACSPSAAATRWPTTRRRCARSPSPRPATTRPTSAPVPAAPSAWQRTTEPRHSTAADQHGERHGGQRRPGGDGGQRL